MALPKASRDYLNEQARCGRCAFLLPDETLHYCPSCGTPFSKIPPTTSFIDLKTAKTERDWQKSRNRLLVLATVGVGFCWIILFSIVMHFRDQEISELRADRVVSIYTYDVPEFPALPSAARRMALGMALQAYEDHFGMQLPQIEIHENSLPSEKLKGWLESPKSQDLTFWQQKIFPYFEKLWRKQPQGTLPVVLTNIPIRKISQGRDGMETRHLGHEGLISGLGHPAFVIIYSYRMLNKTEDSFRYQIANDFERAKHIGVYLIAHELGHALLGLKDYVVPPANPIRRPASLLASENTEWKNCLMHTDEGGGFGAWEALRTRKLGVHSSCNAYDKVVEAHRLRKESIWLLKLGYRNEAREKHLEAIQVAELNLDIGFVKIWKKEHDYFEGIQWPWEIQ